MTGLAAFGVVLAAGYVLWMVQRSLFGPKIERFEGVKDASPMDMLPVAALAASVLIVGIYPAVITDVFASGLEPLAQSLQEAALASVR